MKYAFRILTFVLFGLALIAPRTAVAQETAVLPVVQAVLFYSPTCPHCHEVMTNVLPPLADKYGDQLQILGIDVNSSLGDALYEATVEHYEISGGRLGVPTLILGQTILVGSGEIPDQLPDLIETGLAAGGVGWPDIPGLQEAVPDLPPSADPALVVVAAETAVPVNPQAPAEAAPADQTGTLNLHENPFNETAASPKATDWAGMIVGWMVFLGMLAALVYGVWRSVKTSPTIPDRLADPEARLVRSSAVPILVVLGLGIAVYLAYVEVTQVTAVCGPIGECNLVQSSQYARIVGVPVAILGAVNYLVLGVLWLFQKPLNARFHNLGVLGLLVLTSVGMLFSIYLTLLELLVIGAVCAWCLSSAVITTLLFLIVVQTLTRRPSPIAPRFSAGV